MECSSCFSNVAIEARFCGNCGTPVGLASSEVLATSSLLQEGRYAIESKLGQGGFGITYRGRDIRLQRDVAIKEYFLKGSDRHASGSVFTTGASSRQAEFEKYRDKFLEEARILARFRHPGIVPVHDTFEENGTAYIVMEYLTGLTLREVLAEKGKLSADEAQQVMLRVMDALEEVHGAGLLHRDIKPDNLMCIGERVVLIDFGAARDYNQIFPLQPAILTRRYAPPEQYGSWASLSPSTDLYALGATIYHTLMGEPPPEALKRISGEALNPLPDGLPERLARAVMACLELDQARRATSVAALREILLGPQVPLTVLEVEIQQAAPGAEIRIAPGVYELTRPLRLSKPISLIGTGHHQVILRCAEEVQVLLYEGEGLLKLEGISLEHYGEKTADVAIITRGIVEISECAFRGAVGKTVSGVWFRGTVEGIIRNSLFENNGGFGIYMAGRTTVTLEGNICRENGQAGVVYTDLAGGLAINNVCDKNVNQGFVLTAQSAPTLEGNTCRENRHAGIAYYDNSGGLARHNTCQNNATDGIVVHEEATPVLEGNILLENRVSGLSFHDSSRSVARGNRCEKNQAHGIQATEQAAPLLEDNLCQSNHQCGISYFHQTAGTARNNTCTGSGKYGIFVGGQSQPALEGNTCSGNQHSGIAFGDRAQGAGRNNLCQQNFCHGIQTEGQAEPSLEGNICTENLKSGIQYLSSSSGKLRDNRCEGNGKYGIHLGGDGAPTLEQNTCCANQNSGIAISETCRGEARRNTCIGNRYHGILVEDRAAPILESNICSENARSGISCTEASQGSLRGNTIERNLRHGIFLEDRANVTLVENICRDNGKSGIVYAGEAEGEARNNRCEANAGDGIYVSEQAGPRLLGNICLDNRRHAVAVEKTSSPRLEASEVIDGMVYLEGNAT